MWFRRAVYLAIFPAAVLLPLWVLVTRAIIADASTSDVLLYLVGCPALFVLMAVTGGLLRARKSVRTARVLSLRDASVLAVGWLALLASGIFALPLLAVIDIVLVIGAFWLAAWELVDETRKRVRTFVETVTTVPTIPGATPSTRIPPARGETIIIDPGQ